MEINCRILFVCLAALLLSCSKEDSGDNNVAGSDSYVPVEFSMSLKSSERTKAVTDITQGDEKFRGLEDIVLIPFAKKGTIEAGDVRLGLCDGLENISKLNPDNNSYLYEQKFIPRRTSSFLLYGKSKQLYVSKAYQGSLIASGLDGKTAGDISFSPDPIQKDSPSDTKMQNILDYLNTIALSEYYYYYSWRTSSDDLGNLFNTFTNNGEQMAGSSESIRHLLNLVYNKARNMGLYNGEAGLRDAILNNILSHGVVRPNNSTGIVLPNEMKDYPAKGLPDGAAVIRWNGSRFVAGEDTGAIIAKPDRFCYPVCLWYYSNSRINTTANKNYTYLFLNDNIYKGSTYNTWDKVLAAYEIAHGTVEPETVGAALINPIQYGVGLFEFTLNKVQNSYLPDKDNNYIWVDNSYFPVTGLIIGGQRVQGFNFTPTGEEDYYIYDTNFSNSAYLSSTQSAVPLQSLVLESVEDAIIHFAIELQNNSGEVFTGATGDILPGEKFYLLGDLNLETLRPEQRTRDGILVRKVFEQDRRTPVSVIVRSLKEAYNTIPDLRDPQLQIGVEARIDWVMSTPADIPLY